MTWSSPQRSQLLLPSPWELRFQPMNFGGHKHPYQNIWETGPLIKKRGSLLKHIAARLLQVLPCPVSSQRQASLQVIEATLDDLCISKNTGCPFVGAQPMQGVQGNERWTGAAFHPLTCWGGCRCHTTAILHFQHYFLKIPFALKTFTKITFVSFWGMCF